MNGLQSVNALSCIKHFPGAGSSTKDSHLELPVILESREQLLNYNMYPFVNLLSSDALMSSHCLYKSFDDYPSTLSKVLLTDVLRKEYGFEGLKNYCCLYEYTLNSIRTIIIQLKKEIKFDGKLPI